MTNKVKKPAKVNSGRVAVYGLWFYRIIMLKYSCVFYKYMYFEDNVVSLENNIA